MKLIAKRPCSFGGQQFYIGDEIPTNLVTDAKQQEHYGIISVVNTEGVLGGDASTPRSMSNNFYAQDQYEQDMAELKEYRSFGLTPEKMRQINESYTELAEELARMKEESDKGIVINLRGWDYSETGKGTNVTATPEQIKHTFGILQCTADDGTKYIQDITDEVVLLLIYAADSRKTVKNAAKEQRNELLSTKEKTSESVGCNPITGTNTEGVDT